MKSDSRKNASEVVCASCEEIRAAAEKLGVFPIVLGVDASFATHRFFVHRRGDIKEQARRAFEASATGRVLVKKLLQDK